MFNKWKMNKEHDNRFQYRILHIDLQICAEFLICFTYFKLLSVDTRTHTHILALNNDINNPAASINN